MRDLVAIKWIMNHSYFSIDGVSFRRYHWVPAIKRWWICPTPTASVDDKQP